MRNACLFWICLLLPGFLPLQAWPYPAGGLGTVSISGTITRPDGEPVQGVRVMLEGDEQSETQTNADGQYTFLATAGGAYRIRPCAGEGLLTGVTTLDLVLVRQHILGIQPLPDPYAMIRADINNDGGIDLIDLADLRNLIMGSSQVFPRNTPWRFIPTAYSFPDPENPFDPAFPESLTFQADTDIIGADFYILKTGDIQEDALPPPGGECGPAWAVLSGRAFFDADENCLFDAGELPLEGRIIRISGNGTDWITRTQAGGRYRIALPEGSYEVNAVAGQEVWASCPAEQVSLESGAAETQDAGLIAAILCPWLRVELSSAVLEPCQPATYHIEYENIGTTQAVSAQIELALDPWMAFETADIPWESPDGTHYFFNLGDLDTGVSGRFSVRVFLSCDALPGQAHRLEARIEPDYLSCLPSNPAWDGSSLRLEGRCEQDSLRFELINDGAGMQESMQFIVIEDDMIMRQEPFQLGPGENLPLVWEGTGATYRVEFAQSTGHPGLGHPSLAVEACGTGGNGNFSTGFTTVFAEDEADDFVSVSALESLDAVNPFYKDGYPKGYRFKRLIEAGDFLDYQIRFQNTGTDTLPRIAVIDSLSAHLDWTTFAPGPCSSPCNVKLIPGTGAVFLMDQASLAPGDGGFIHFRIRTREDLPNGTLIRNPAEIYLDQQPAATVITSYHTIGSGFVESIPLQAESAPLPSPWRLFPNPAVAYSLLLGPQPEGGAFTLEIRDAMGRLLRTERFVGPHFRIERKDLPAGLYTVFVTPEKGHSASLRLIFF